MNYDLCLELAQNLEAIKEMHLQDASVVGALADLIYRYNILDLPYLNKLAESLIVHKSSQESQPSFELTPESLIRNDLLSEDLKPWAEELRNRFFNEVEAPFKSFDDAAQWIIQNEAPMSPQKNGISTGRARRSIRIYDNFSEHAIVLARIGSPLEKIIFACQKLTKQLEIGLEWNSLVFYILANIPPFIPPIEMDVLSYVVSLPSGRELGYREANVTIREGFNRTYLSWMYEQLRHKFQLTKKKSLSSLHLELYQLVRKNGGAPKGRGTVAFWESVMGEWNTTHPKNKYKTWRGVKINYERAINKLRPTHKVWLQKEEVNHERSHNKEIQE